MESRLTKFKVWDPVTKRMYEPKELKICITHIGDRTIMTCEVLDTKKKIGASDTGLIFLQGSGRRDVNGKEIFEGDIVETICFEGITRLEEMSFIDGGLMLKPNEDHHSPLLLWSCVSVLVKGNVYQNKELLTRPEQQVTN